MRHLVLSAAALLVLSSCCRKQVYPFLSERKVSVSQSETVEVALEETYHTITGELPKANPAFMPVTERIYAGLTEVPEAMERYTETVPLAADAEVEMVPIKGGTFSFDGTEVRIDPFWMAKTETTWALYRAFMENGKGRNKDGTLNMDGDIYSSDPPFAGTNELTDAVSQPTPPYMPMHFDLANSAGYAANLPAIAMTQHAASKFCEWLTAQTGHYYRLPTEAEWEYACRAGTTTRYSFGDEGSQLGDYAWYFENSDGSYQEVGKKKPNPWGLHDMHGNVAEWTLDFHLPKPSAAANAANPLTVSPSRYPRVVRGGHWDADPQDLSSSSRLASDPSWKMTDPQGPKSIWYHTDVLWLGFRIVRPQKTPSLEEMHLLWNLGPGEL